MRSPSVTKTEDSDTFVETSLSGLVSTVMEKEPSVRLCVLLTPHTDGCVPKCIVVLYILIQDRQITHKYRSLFSIDLRCMIKK